MQPILTLSDIMTRAVKAVTAETALGDAARLMAERRISSVLVIEGSADGTAAPIGILTERDTLRAWGRGIGTNHPVREAMTAPLHTAPQETEWKAAYHLLILNGIRHLGVTGSGGEIVGIVSDTDFRAHLAQDFLSRYGSVSRIMRAKVPTFPPTAALSEVVDAMAVTGASCAIAIVANRPAGIITERDVARYFTRAGESAELSLAEVMTAPVETIPAATTLQAAYQIMIDRGIRHLVVTMDDGSISGTVEEHDLVSILEEQYLEELRWNARTLAASLTDASAQLRAIFQGRSSFIGLLDLEGRIIGTNAPPFSGRNSEPEALTGQLIWEAPWWNGDSDLRESFRKATAGAREGGPTRFETFHPSTDGSGLWVEFSLLPIQDEDRKSTFLLVEGTDITARKRAEHALRDNERQFKALADFTPAMFWLADRSKKCIWFNKAWLDFTGRSLAEEIGDGWTDKIHPQDLADCVKIYVSHFERHEAFRMEYRLRRADGAWRWILDSGAPVFDDHGEFVGYIGSCMDITERVQMGEQLRLHAAVFGSSQEGVVVTDPRGSIVAVNPAFTQITLYSEAELIGRNMRMLQSGRHDKTFYRNLWRAINTEGYWQGEIWNRRRNGDVYPELLTISTVKSERGEVLNYIGTFTDITRIKQSEAELERLALHDPLTGLPNRTLLVARLEQAVIRTKRAGKRGAVLFLDLDRFKNVNDSLGHPAGDELLIQVAERLRSRLRESDTLARLGGDEFVILLEEMEAVEDPAELAQAIIARLAEPTLLSESREVFVGTSVGISLFPDDGTTAVELLKHADTALYKAKNEQRGSYQFYTSALTEAANARLRLEADLRRSIERDELRLHYQPLVSLADGRVIGVEALVRWQPRGAPLIMPDSFIPLAEETRFVIQLGDWVLRESCRQMRTWHEAGVPLEQIAVNLSAIQFQAPDLAERVSAILAETGLAPRHLELEVTESCLMGEAPEITAKLQALKAVGARISIDDFGTGYSSMAYLKRFPIDKLKIDRSFVQGIPDDTASVEIARAIIALGQSLGLEILAEGVEDRPQLDCLTGYGCDFGQGYFFGRPMAAEHIPDAVRRLSGGMKERL